jgi:hypothetical protein
MTGEANREAVGRIAKARPVLTDLRRAGDVLSGLDGNTILHAGPPLRDAHHAIDVLRGAITGTLVSHGRAADEAAAWELVSSGKMRLAPANDHGACCTFAAVITADTPVFVVEEPEFGMRAVAAINEGRGRALRYGSTDAAILDRLGWLEGEFAETLGAAIRSLEGLDVFAIMAQALHMGDECHSRQKAASALFLAAVMSALLETGAAAGKVRRAVDFLAANDFFFLPLAMAAAKAAMGAADGVPQASIVTCMCANGAEFGIKVAGLPGSWFAAPVPKIHGKYFSGFESADAGPVIGDSEIVETLGLGALAMAAAPAFAPFAAKTVRDVIKASNAFYAITCTEHEMFTVPNLEFRGAPLGIDCRRVAELGTPPIFSTGIAHRECGIGQIGAGVGTAPIACFIGAAEALSRSGSR